MGVCRGLKFSDGNQYKNPVSTYVTNLTANSSYKSCQRDPAYGNWNFYPAIWWYKLYSM